jgi:cell volume regulation protein A
MFAAILLMFAVISSKLSERAGIPALILFLALGMLAGSDGPGGIFFNDASFARLVGTIALIYILFSGAIETNWASVQPVMTRGIILSTAGVFITAALVGFFAHIALNFPLKEGLLLGAIISSTDAPAVFTILRSRKLALKGNLKSLLELESGSNDPTAVFLTIAMIQIVIGAEYSAMGMILRFIYTSLCGVLLGVVWAKIGSYVINRIRLDYEGLYPVMSMAMALMVYSMVEIAKGNGFLAVYVFGLVLGKYDFTYKRSLIRFHNGLAWLMQITMFIILGLLAFPSKLPAVAVPGLLVSAFLIVAARPIAVFLCMYKSDFSVKERILTAWTGLRGSAPIILATFPVAANCAGAEKIFNIVFFVVLISVTLQGTSLLPLTRKLGLCGVLETKPRYPLEFDKTQDTETQSREYEIPPESTAVGKTIAELDLPKGALILLIRRGSKFVVPRGNVALEAYDTLLVLAEEEDLHTARQIIKGI